MSLAMLVRTMNLQDRKMLSKRRRKWNRRISIAKACKDLTLRHVRKYKTPLWMDHYDLMVELQRKRKRSMGKKNDLTINEISNRARHLLCQPFIIQEYHDKVHSGAIKRRYRAIVFSITDLDSLEEYILDLEENRDKVV